MGAHKNFSAEEQRLGEMASAESEPITGVWGQSPQRGPGAEALVKGQGQSPLKLKALKHLYRKEL